MDKIVNRLSIFILIIASFMMISCNNSTTPVNIETEGLAYKLNADNKSYSVKGIGTTTDKDIIIPSTYEGLSVTGIEESTFRLCGSLESIEIPNRESISDLHPAISY